MGGVSSTTAQHTQQCSLVILSSHANAFPITLSRLSLFALEPALCEDVAHKIRKGRQLLREALHPYGEVKLASAVKKLEEL